MQSDESRLRSTALLWTVAACVLLEAVALLVFRLIAETWAEAVFVSLIVVGPVSIWIAKPFYRYWLSAGR